MEVRRWGESSSDPNCLAVGNLHQFQGPKSSLMLGSWISPSFGITQAKSRFNY